MFRSRDPKTLPRGKWVIVPNQCRDPTTVGGVPIPGADVCLQKQLFGGGIHKPAHSSEAVGHNIKGDGKDGINGAGPGRNLQGGGAVNDIIRHLKLGGDWGDAQGPDGVPLSGGAMDHRGGSNWRGRRRVGVPSGR